MVEGARGWAWELRGWVGGGVSGVCGLWWRGGVFFGALMVGKQSRREEE